MKHNNFINYNKVLNNLTQYLLAGNAGHAMYDYGKGERLNTQSPILVGTQPVYFVQVVTPTDRIYLKINSVLFTEGIKMFSLLTGTTAAIIFLVFLLRKWYSILEDEVAKRTRDLNESNYKLMKANESLKIKDEAQNQFINVAAHELRTPIQPILNAIYLLQSAELSISKKNQYIDIIKRNTEKLGRLAEDILDVTRIESNTLKLMNERLNLYDLISNIVEEYKRNIQFIYKDLVVNYGSPSKTIFVTGDRLRLNQVLLNLLDNAGKFTKKGSITVTSAIMSNKVQVTVKDTGVGIHNEIFPKLFSKFVTRSDRGTGLGLFISKSIIEAHGGKIWAESSSQQEGATFIFTLPLLDKENGERQEENDKKKIRIGYLQIQRRLFCISIVVLLGWLVVMCHCYFHQGGYAQEQNQSSRNIDDKSLRVAYLTDGLFTNAGWGAFAYNGGQEIISKYGYGVTFLDNVSISNIETTLKDYADGNYDIIIAQGYEWGDPVIQIAKKYPDIKFIVFTGLVKSENVASIFPKQQEATYLLGALAGMLSKNHTIGFIGGDEKYPNLKRIYEGYKQGALDVNSTTKVLVTYLDDWDNETKGKSAALSQIEQGADFILHVADTAGQGVINAAKEKGIYAFGAVTDQNKLAPDTVVTSFVLDPVKAYDSVFKMIRLNNFTGMIYTPGIESTKNSTTEDGILYIAPFHGFENKIPKDIQDKFLQLSQDIKNKKIKVSE